MKSSINVNDILSLDYDNNNNNNTIIKSFISRAIHFIQKTEKHTLQGLNPNPGNIHGVLPQLYYIWSHQIFPNKEKIIYGRGSPEKLYHAVIAGPTKQTTFEGFLPTTIYNVEYCEVYGLNPDMDSTVLMINTTSWILPSYWGLIPLLTKLPRPLSII
jgi:hypothetical protein